MPNGVGRGGMRAHRLGHLARPRPRTHSRRRRIRIMDLGTTKMIARKEGGIGWMIFNQPEKHNAVSVEMWTAVPKIVAAFEADPEVRAIVLAGAGERAFVSGADISEFERRRDSEDAIKAYDAVGEAAHAALAGALKPTIAMIRGICFGGGVGIALTTDLRICS